MNNGRPTYVFNIADCVDDIDPQKRTFRQIHAAQQHNIPIRALVEIYHEDEPSPMDGARLFVVYHGRDCDMTPLYGLCADPRDTVQENPRFSNPKWYNGYSEDSLKVIRLPPSPSPTHS